MSLNVDEHPVAAPAAPAARLCVGVTGHREDNPSFLANSEAIERAFDRVLSLIDIAEATARTAGADIATTRLHSLLADGTDELAARGALARGWELVAPLPFGLALNVAINAHPASVEDAHALLRGPGEVDRVHAPAVRERATRLFALAAQAQRFELADRDALIVRLYLEKLAYREDQRSDATFSNTNRTS